MWINSSITTAQNAELACLDHLGEHRQSTLKTTLYFTKKESRWQMAKTPGSLRETNTLVRILSFTTADE